MKLGSMQWAFFWLAALSTESNLYLWTVWIFTLFMSEEDTDSNPKILEEEK